MLVRSTRLPYLLIFIAICILWTNRDTFLTLQASDWTTYTLDLSAGYWFNGNSSVLEPNRTDVTIAPNLSASIPPLSRTTTGRKPVATAFPVISKPSPYGYVFYATADEYACAALLNIKRLRGPFRTRHQIHVLATSTVSEGYLNAFKSLGAIVTIQTPPPLGEGGIPYYDGCLLKLISFRMHQIQPTLSRILVLDADQLILRSLDSLFELPDVDLAAPRAYWIGKDAFASTFLLITLGDRLWEKVNEGMKNIQGDVYDMDLVNQLFAETVMMLPGSYITLNSHFEDWNMPNWYRPEEKNRKTNLLDEKKEEDIADLWEAINVIVENSDEPIGIGGTQALHQKRQLEEAVPRNDMESARNNVIHPTTSEPDGSIVETVAPTALPGIDGATSSSSSETLRVQETGMALPTHDVLEKVDLNLLAHNSNNTDSTPKLMDENALPSTSEPQSLEATISQEINAQATQTAEAAKPSEPVLPPPFPYNQDNHPLRNDLYDLYRTAFVLHYTAIGKPWMYSVNEVKEMKPQAHPALYEQFELWRWEAIHLCPKIRTKKSVSHNKADLWKSIVDTV
jgi:hypothetical protein